MIKNINEFIKDLFLRLKLEKINSIQRVNIGFKNEVYLVNNKFIVKICKDKKNEKNFKREIRCYKFFKSKIPVPQLIYSDTSKKKLDKYYMLYHKIEGDNLYSRWHLLSNKERKDIIKQICKILKIINGTKISVKKDGYKERLKSIQKFLNQVKRRKIISKNFTDKIENFIEENKKFLKEQKLGLVYGDIHFDNFLIKNKRIVGLIDFEETDIMSIDYALDSIRRMSMHPKLYISKDREKLIKKKDYSLLLKGFKEYYPELFDFDHLQKRLDLYSIEFNLKLLPDWPNCKSLKKRLAKIIHFNGRM